MVVQSQLTEVYCMHICVYILDVKKNSCDNEKTEVERKKSKGE